MRCGMFDMLILQILRANTLSFQLFEEEKIMGLGTAGGHVQHETEEIQMSHTNLSGLKTLW